MKTIRYDDLIENIKALPLQLKKELKLLIEHYIVEEKREQILKNYKKSKKEYINNNLRFSSNIDELKNFINE